MTQFFETLKKKHSIIVNFVVSNDRSQLFMIFEYDDNYVRIICYQILKFRFDRTFIFFSKNDNRKKIQIHFEIFIVANRDNNEVDAAKCIVTKCVNNFIKLFPLVFIKNEFLFEFRIMMHKCSVFVRVDMPMIKN